MATTKTPSELHEALAASDTPECQREALRCAQNTGNIELLVELCKNKNLAPDVDETLGTVRRAAVVAAWLTAATRTPEQVNTLLERRQSEQVRAAAATLTGLGDELYQKLADQGGIRTAIALLGNASTPRPALMSAAGTYGARYAPGKSGHRPPEEVLPVNNPEVCLQAWETAGSRFDKWVLSTFELTREQLKVFTLDRYRDGATQEQQFEQLSMAAFRLPSQPNLNVDRYMELLSGILTVFTGVINDSILRPFIHARQSAARTKTMARYDMPSLTGPEVQLTPAELHRAIKQVHSNQDVEAAVPLFAQHALQPDDVELLARVVPPGRRRPQALRMLASAHAGNTDLMALAIARLGYPGRKILESVDGPALADRLTDPDGFRVVPAPMWVLQIPGISDKVAARATLAELLDSDNPTHQRLVCETAAEALSTDEQWDAFARLGTEMNASFEDLLATAAAVCR